MTWGLVVSQRGEHHDHQASDLERSDRERSGRAERLWWMREARFGLFVHWGLYSVAARHEWVKQRERLDDAAYQRYFEHFDPDLYDPRRWAQLARRAGMRYAVLTTKHHEGFCLWNSALTDYKATNTPAGRDLVGPWVEAFRAEGLKIGFYHSLLDWHHPEFPIDGMHPQRDDEQAQAAAKGRDVSRYADYLHGQVRELLTGYGPVDYLFFDFSYPGRTWGGKGRDDWRSEELLALVRSLQPDVVVNDRLDLELEGDVLTPEQYQPTSSLSGDGRLWEACQTLNGSWGYDRDNLDWKTPDQLIRMLVDGVSKDGNLLLNAGPTGRGEFEPRAVGTLDAIGRWMDQHARSVYGAGPAPYVPPPDTRYTQRGDRLYLHLFAWPFRHVHLPGLAGRVRFAQFLHDGSEIPAEVIDPARQAQNTTMSGLGADVLTLTLPVRQPDVAVPVVELFLEPQR
jgi:alpha-L-fucosidase